jgi:hypothetical protein
MTEKPFEIDIEVTEKGPEVTPFAGLVPFVRMCEAMKLPEIIDQNLHIRDEKGYKDSEQVMSPSLCKLLKDKGQTIDDLGTFFVLTNGSALISAGTDVYSS